MDLLLKELRAQATKYEGLRIDSYIRQGSSRDGLKVIAADEFDIILEFHIEGLEGKIHQRTIYKNGSRSVPGFCFMVVESISMEKLAVKFPQLYREGVFVLQNGIVHISSRCLYQKVFESMFDKACNKIVAEISSCTEFGQTTNFSLKRKMNPPAINITILLDDDDHKKFMKAGQPKNLSNLVKEIDVDVVPGFLLRYDMETKYEGVALKCPIHAVCKWAEEERSRALDFVNTCLVWDVKTTGYEKHLLDVARRDRKKLYILTALRIVKTYFTRTKTIAKEAGHPPPQIVTVLKSYHLKQIAIYLLYYLCHVHPQYRLYGTHRATLYFIDMMTTALEAGHLPHFFYSNNKVQVMLPGYPSPTEEQLKYDLFRGISRAALDQAKQSHSNHLIPNLGFNFGDGCDSERNTVLSEFRGTLERGDFF